MTGAVYIVAESRLSQLPSKKPKADPVNGAEGSKISNSKPKGSVNEKAKSGVDSGQYELVEKIQGSSLVGLK